ncbi:hypothetical protein ACFE04_010926 [Oxalis oulophora]
MATNKAVMRAVQYEKFGKGSAGLKLVQIPMPSPKNDELLIKMEAVSLNPVDLRIQKRMTFFIPYKLPYIPATDVAGEVVAVGARVTKFKAGDKVVALLNNVFGGGLAEFVVAKERMTILRPEEVSAEEGAGLPMAALTAHQALTRSGGVKLDRSGNPKNILITGASGGVGHFAVQLAKQGNNHVTATCSKYERDFVTDLLEADEWIDNSTPQGKALRSPSGKNYDLVLHCAPQKIPWSVFESVLSERGKVVHLMPSYSTFGSYVLQKTMFWKKKTLLPFVLIPKAENMEFLMNLMAEGKVRTFLESVHSLTEARNAWRECARASAAGKIVIRV